MCAAGLEDVTRPLRSVERPRHNLPAQLTSFVGRETEMRDVRALLRAAAARHPDRRRRLRQDAPRAASRASSSSAIPADEVWFVELASVRDPERVASAVAAALDVRTEGARDVPDELINALRDREIVLVLDNCEHLLDACAALVHGLLRSCVGRHGPRNEP